MWYGELFVIEEYTEGKSWYEIDNVFHEFGFRFTDKDEIAQFLSGNHEAPVIESITLDQDAIKFESTGSNINFHPIRKSVISDNEVFVYHGNIYTSTIEYSVEVKSKFKIEGIEFSFIDCDEYGFLLKDIYYEDLPMRKVYGGSNIEVRPSWTMFTKDEMKKVYSLLKLNDFLNISFKKENWMVRLS